MSIEREINSRYLRYRENCNEKMLRLFCANEAIEYGFGGITVLQKITGTSRKTIRKGIKELQEKVVIKGVRKSGGGRKNIAEKDTKIVKEIEEIIESSTRGDPESPLLWCSKSLRNIAGILNANSKRIGIDVLSKIMKDKLGYSLQVNRKTQEGCKYEQRDDQFNNINAKIKDFQSKNYPVISVDCKKKENIGNFKNNGREYRKTGDKREVKCHDFIDVKLGKVVPFGVYDISKNTGLVNVGISSDTAEFSVHSIETWWKTMGKDAYPEAKELMITADCGGSNSVRGRLWKSELQKLADKINITINVSHFPPGTSKWNKIEHCMFSFISKNWAGQPLVDIATVINLIGATKTKTGLQIEAVLDENIYETKIKISDEDFAKINLQNDEYLECWNYRIQPNNYDV
jgi:hypothetical protein